MLWLTVSWPISLGVKPHMGPKTRFLLLSDSFGFVDVARPLRRKDKCVIHNYYWFSPAQSFLGLNLKGLMTKFYCLKFETPPAWRARSPIYIPRKMVGLVIPLGTRIRLRPQSQSLLQLMVSWPVYPPLLSWQLWSHFWCCGTQSCLSVSPSVTFAIVSSLLERLVQWETAHLPGWMAPDVADAWWCRPRLRGQPSFQLTSMGPRSSGWKLQASTTIAGCCGHLGSFIGVIRGFPLSSSLLTEFFDGQRRSNCDLGCFSFDGTVFEDCCYVL
jgi:hypothetical protein